MEQSPWEANSKDNQEIPRHKWKTIVHCCIRKHPPLILNELHPVHTSLHYFPKIHFTVILPSTPSSSEWSLSFRFSYQILYTYLISPLLSTCPVHLFLVDVIILIKFDYALKLWSFSLCILLHSSTTCSLLRPNIVLSTLLSNKFKLRSSLTVRDQVSHPYKTTSNPVLNELCFWTLSIVWCLKNWRIKNI